MKKVNGRTCLLITIFVMTIVSVFVYYFSIDAKLRVFSCTGNYYFSNQEIYNMAGVDSNTRKLFATEMRLRKKIEKNPIIDRAEVYREKEKISFHIYEKTIVGYYVKKNTVYVVFVDGSSIPLKKEYEDSVIHFPLLNGLSQSQIKDICKVFKKYDKYLTREVIEKIAEIVPFESSYDKNMLKITMQDGNIVFSRMEDLKMMSRYKKMLTGLKGKSVCLLFDAKNSVIATVRCDYMTMTKEEREAYRKEQEEIIKEQEQKEQEQTEEEQSPQVSQEDPNQDMVASDWVETSLGYLYSASTGLYKDASTGNYFVWDDVMGLVPVE